MTVTVLTTTTTRTSRREPLKLINMAASQGRPASSSVRGNGEKARGRRTSSRLSAKEDGEYNGATSQQPAQERPTRNAVKRNAGEFTEKNGLSRSNGYCHFSFAKIADFELLLSIAAYDEDIGGFQFKRGVTKKLKSGSEGPSADDVTIEKPVVHSPRKGRPPKNNAAQLSGHTTLEDAASNARNGKGQRGRPKKISLESEDDVVKQTRKRNEEATLSVEKPAKKGRPAKAKTSVDTSLRSPEPSQGSTSRIALPLADTPVIRRNKEMREGRAGKGQRRSSLGMRGRRASSLIDSGASNGMDPS